MKKKYLHAYLVVFVACFTMSVYAKSTPSPNPQATQKKLAALSVMIENLKKKIQTQKQKEAQALLQLEETKKRLTKAAQLLEQLTKNIENKKNRLATLTQTIQSLEDKQAHSKAVLNKIIQLQFESHQQKHNILTAYTKQSKPQHHLYSYYAKAQTEQIRQLIDEFNNYKILQQTAEQEKIALNILQSEVIHQNRQLKQEQMRTQNTLPLITQERTKHVNQLNNKIDEQKQLEILLKKLRAKTVFIAPHDTINRRHQFAKLAGKFSLPSHPQNPNCIKNAKSKFIIPEQNEACVRSIYPGRIIFSEFLRGIGLLIIIDHGEGYMSLYGNNQTLYKKTGDWVNMHEKIAVVRNEIGKQNSGLYFEIRKDGRALNLKQWMQPA